MEDQTKTTEHAQLSYAAVYYRKNKERLNRRSCEKIECPECHSIVARGAIYKHRESLRHRLKVDSLRLEALKKDLLGE